MSASKWDSKSKGEKVMAKNEESKANRIKLKSNRVDPVAYKGLV